MVTCHCQLDGSLAVSSPNVENDDRVGALEIMPMAESRSALQVVLKSTLPIFVAFACPVVAKAEGVSATRLIAAFEAMCLATNADATAALAEADRQHWKPPSGSMSNVRELVRVGAETGDTQGLSLGTNTEVIAGVTMKQRRCSVMANVDSPRAVFDQAEKWVVNIRPQIFDDARQWTYADTKGGKREISNAAFFKETVRAGQYRQLLVSDAQSGHPGGVVGLEIIFGSMP